MFTLCLAPYAFGLLEYHHQSITKLDKNFKIFAYIDSKNP